MRVIGLTGGIGMGKSTAAAVFRRAHIPVFDADAVVHQLQAQGGAAVAAIGAAFAGSIQAGAVDRSVLRTQVFADPSALRRLEAVLHPLLGRARQNFIARNRRRGVRIVVLDVPLLFETGGDTGLDAVAVVTAPGAVQWARVRRRGLLTDQQIAAIITRQMPDQERRRRADVLIHTGLSRHHSQRQIRRLLSRIQ